VLRRPPLSEIETPTHKKPEGLAIGFTHLASPCIRQPTHVKRSLPLVRGIGFRVQQRRPATWPL